MDPLSLASSSSSSSLRPSSETIKINLPTSSNKRKSFESDPDDCSAPKKAQRDDVPNTDSVSHAEGDLPPKTEPEMQHPIFSTDLVMLKVLGNLKNSDLFNCRKVSSGFKAYSTEILCKLSRRSGVTFNYHWGTKEYSTSFSRTVKSLTSFSEFLEECEDSHFLFKSLAFGCGKFVSLDLQKFLIRHGRKVRSLSIELFPPMDSSVSFKSRIYPSVTLFQKVFLSQIPNVESLTLIKFPLPWKSGPSPLDLGANVIEIKLRSLKTLLMDERTLPTHILIDILNAAVNLEHYSASDEPKSEIMQHFYNAGRLRAIKKLIWKPSAEEIDMYENIVKDSEAVAQLRLTSLHLDFREIPCATELWTRLGNICSKLLESSASSLREFNSETSLGFLGSRLQLPRLTNVKSVLLGTSASSSVIVDNQTGPYCIVKKYFPAGFQFCSVFPNVTQVEISFHITASVPWETYFDIMYDPVPSVKTLKIGITRNFSVKWLRDLAALFPNTESLIIKTQYFDFPNAAKHGLWSFKKLQYLDFKIDVTRNMSLENAFPTLDSAFTGFTEDTVLKLHENCNSIDILQVESLREKPSIVNLTELREFYLDILDHSTVDRTGYPCVLTNVTGKFGFGMCPLLKVYLQSDADKTRNRTALAKRLSVLQPYTYKQKTHIKHFDFVNRKH